MQQPSESPKILSRTEVSHVELPATATGKFSAIIEAHTDGFKPDLAITVPL